MRDFSALQITKWSKKGPRLIQYKFIYLDIKYILYLFVEIPVFHFLNARITFGNINGINSAVPGVQSQTTSEPSSEEETGNEPRITCSIGMDVFSPPSDYVDRSRTEQRSGGFNDSLPLCRLGF